MSVLIKSILWTNITKSVIVPQSGKEHRRHSTANKILQVGQFGANQIERMYKNYQAWSSIFLFSIFLMSTTDRLIGSINLP